MLCTRKWFALVDDLHKNSNNISSSKNAGTLASLVIETLSSISDRKWVVAECLLRVAPTHETQKLFLSRVVAETERFSSSRNDCTGEESKWWLRARLVALGALDRLETLRAMHLGNFSSSAFESFRFVDYLDAAKAVARAGNARGLEILLQRHKEWFRNHDLLDILAEIPECASVSEYKASINRDYRWVRYFFR